jgi:hypothetical protein
MVVVMPGFVPGSHVFTHIGKKDVDGRTDPARTPGVGRMIVRAEP